MYNWCPTPACSVGMDHRPRMMRVRERLRPFVHRSVGCKIGRTQYRKEPGTERTEWNTRIGGRAATEAPENLARGIIGTGASIKRLNPNHNHK